MCVNIYIYMLIYIYVNIYIYMLIYIYMRVCVCVVYLCRKVEAFILTCFLNFGHDIFLKCPANAQTLRKIVPQLVHGLSAQPGNPLPGKLFTGAMMAQHQSQHVPIENQ